MAETTTIRVVINALTEGAEESIDDVGDEISGLADDAAVGQTALDQLSDELSAGTRQSILLQEGLDQLDDEIGDVGNRALYAQAALDQLNDEITETATRSGMASGMLATLQSALSGTGAASTALSIAFYVSLIPAILTLLTVIAPLVTGLVVLAGGAAALAGAFAAVVGSGILAFGAKKSEQNKEELAQTERLIAQYESLKEQTGSLSASEQQRLEQLREKKKRLEEQTGVMGALKGVMADLKDELVPLIREFGEEFIPLIEGAIDAIPELMDAMFASVGGTEEFREALSDFGAAAMEVIPALTGFMFQLARDALPLAREFFNWLLDNGGDIWDAMMKSLVELEPQFRNLLDALIDMGPVLLEFGTNVAKEVLPALTKLIRWATGFMETVNGLPAPLRKVTIWLLILAPLLLKVGSALGTVLTWLTGKGLLANLGRLIVHFSSASSVTGALANSLSLVTGAISSAVSWFLAGSAAAMALAGVIGALIGLGVVFALEWLGVFDMIKNAGEATADALGETATDIVMAFLTPLAPLAALGGLILGLVQGDLDLAVQNAKQILGEFGGAWVGLFEDIWGVLTGIADLLMRFLGNSIIPDIINSGLQHILEDFKLFWLGLVPNVIRQGLDWIAGKLSGFNQNILQPFIAGVQGAFNAGGGGGGGGGALSGALTGLDMALSTAGPGGAVASAGLDVIGGAVGGGGGGGGGSGQQQPQITNINGGLNVETDARGHVQRNPNQWSRRAAGQINMELRNNHGANR